MGNLINSSASNTDTTSLQSLGEQTVNIPEERENTSPLAHRLFLDKVTNWNTTVLPLVILLATLKVSPLLHEGSVLSPKMFLRGLKAMLYHCPFSCSHPGSTMLSEYLMLLRGALKHGLEHHSASRDVLKVMAEPRLLTGMEHEVLLSLFK